MKRLYSFAILLAALFISADSWSMYKEAGVIPDASQLDSFLEGHPVSLADADSVNYLCKLMNCLTPQMYGAKGDGRADDTQALREALYQSDCQHKALFFPAGMKYKVTGPLNYYKGKYNSYTLDMIGSIPVKQGSYDVSEYGGIQVMEGVSLFKNATFRGSIKAMCFTGKRRDDVRMFDSCTCSGFVLTESNVSNFGAVFYDTGLDQVSQITCNTFLTVFYFSRNDKTASGFTDSTISFNYINGGVEKKDNACFEWSYYNGALITNNFIDYYRTMYYPVAVKRQAFVGPVSSNNHYQVFRYLYAAGPNIDTMTFYSTNDAFNWNDPNSSEVNFIPMRYTGGNGKSYETPPYIAICMGSWQTVIKGAKIERVVSPLVFVAGSLTEYEDGVFDVEFCCNNQYKGDQINYAKGSEGAVYNGGKYKQNKVRISGLVEKVESLPSLSVGWSSKVNGARVLCGETVYEAVNEQKNGRWEAVWKPVSIK